MVSPAEQVFAITELAESVLQEMSMQDLHLLRRVNKSLLRIITGSNSLRRIAYLHDTHERDVDDEMLNVSYAFSRFHHRLSLRPFHYGGMKYTGGRFGLLADGPDVPTLFFKCLVEFQDGVAAPQPRQGYKGRQKIYGSEQSWAEMRVNRRPSGLRIKIDVTVWSDGKHQGKYFHQTDFQHGQWIIRDLFNIFNNIQQRSLQEHTNRLDRNGLVNDVFSRARQHEAIQGQWMFGTGLMDCLHFLPTHQAPTGGMVFVESYPPSGDGSNTDRVEKHLTENLARPVLEATLSHKRKISASSAVKACRRGLQKSLEQAKRTYAEVVRDVRRHAS